MSKIVLFILKSCLVWRPISKIIMFVFLFLYLGSVFGNTSLDHLTIAEERQGFLKIIQCPPQNNRINNFTSSIENRPLIFELKLLSRSFTKNKNIRLELGSPCSAPMFELKKLWCFRLILVLCHFCRTVSPWLLIYSYFDCSTIMEYTGNRRIQLFQLQYVFVLHTI